MTTDGEFRLDLSADRRSPFGPILGAVAAGLGIVLILTLVRTDLSERLLPMQEDYLDVMIPVPEDGLEPLALQALDHIIDKTQLAVKGTIFNRTDKAVPEMIAVVTAQDKVGHPPEVREIPLTPELIEPGATSEFETIIPLQSEPSGYSVRFRIKDGPFVPHRDERPPPAPTPAQTPAGGKR